MVKRLTSVMLILILLLSQLTTVSFAEETPSYTPLSDFTYTLDEEACAVTLTKYIGADAAVTVAGAYAVDGVSYSTVLQSSSVFIGNSTVTSVVLSEGTSLADNTGAYLFGKCSKLAFADLSGLNTSGMTSMFCMFAYCSALETLDLTGLDTACVTDMTGLFSDCVKLSSLSGYESWNTSSVETIYMAFNKTSSLETIDLSRWDLSRVTNSGWCFQLCNASQILLPDNLKTISAGFLNHANKYAGTSFAVPAGVEKIGYAHTFYDFGTGELTDFTVAEGNTHYKTADGILYSADGKELLAVPRSKDFAGGVYEIPEGVTFLGELCFSRNKNITTLVLPDSLDIYYVGLNDPNYVTCGDDGNLNAGSNLNIAAYCYTGITSYAVKDTNPNYAFADGIIYSKDMTTVVAVPSRYDRYMAIPEGVTAWAQDAMWAVNNHTVTGLMSNCPGVSVPSTLVDISQDQLDKLNRLKTSFATFSITVSADNPVYCLDENGLLTTHSLTTETVAPDCTKQGYTTATCSVCKNSYTKDLTDPLGHCFTNYISNGADSKTAACDRGCGATNTVTTEQPKSNNNALSGISINGAQLEPSFRSDILNYVVRVPFSTDRISVHAAAAHKMARVQVTGNGNLTAGADNVIQVICTAENGSQRTYTLTVKRAAAPVEPEPPENAPEDNKPVDIKPLESPAAATLPAETIPEETTPTETTPEVTTPVETVLENSKPVTETPTEPSAGETAPEETAPAQTQPTESMPEETHPTEESSVPTQTDITSTEPSADSSKPFGQILWYIVAAVPVCLAAGIGIAVFVRKKNHSDQKKA